MPVAPVGVGRVLTAGEHRGQGADQLFDPDGALVQDFVGVNADDRAGLDLIDRLPQARAGHDQGFQGFQLLRLLFGLSLGLLAGFGLLASLGLRRFGFRLLGADRRDTGQSQRRCHSHQRGPRYERGVFQHGHFLTDSRQQR